MFTCKHNDSSDLPRHAHCSFCPAADVNHTPQKCACRDDHALACDMVTYKQNAGSQNVSVVMDVLVPVMFPPTSILPAKTSCLTQMK